MTLSYQKHRSYSLQNEIFLGDLLGRIFMDLVSSLGTPRTVRPSPISPKQ